MDDRLVLEKFSELPEQSKQQVMDFIDFLLKEKVGGTVAKKPVFGSYKGTFKIGDDFDEPLRDFKDYMP